MEAAYRPRRPEPSILHIDPSSSSWAMHRRRLRRWSRWQSRGRRLCHGSVKRQGGGDDAEKVCFS